MQTIQWRRDARWFAFSFMSSAIIPASLFYAILHAGVGISTGLTFIGIVIGMYFFGWLLAGERFSKDKWLSTALGFLGLGLVFAPTISSVGWLGLLAGVGGGFAVGLNIVASKKMPYSTSQTAAIAWSLGLLANLPFVFLLGEPLDVFHWNIAWLYLGLFGLASIAASWTVIRGVKLIEAGAAGILSLVEVVFGVLFGITLFSERPDTMVLLGLAAIIAAAAIPYAKDYNAKRGVLESN
jgi:drug/metabolite transporter (DMT)-like permease